MKNTISVICIVFIFIVCGIESAMCQSYSKSCALIRQKIEQYSQKDEFEKVADYQNRLRNGYLDYFCKMCDSVFTAAIKSQDFSFVYESDVEINGKSIFRSTNNSSRAKLMIGKYDSEKEVFPITLISGTMRTVMILAVPIGQARAFKENWKSLSIKKETYHRDNWMIDPISNELIPQKIFLYCQNSTYTLNISSRSCNIAVYPVKFIPGSEKYLGRGIYNYSEGKWYDDFIEASKNAIIDTNLFDFSYETFKGGVAGYGSGLGPGGGSVYGRGSGLCPGFGSGIGPGSGSGIGYGTGSRGLVKQINTTVNEEGQVCVEVHVMADGTVSEAHVINTSRNITTITNRVIQQQCVAEAKQAKYQPGKEEWRIIIFK